MLRLTTASPNVHVLFVPDEGDEMSCGEVTLLVNGVGLLNDRVQSDHRSDVVNTAIDHVFSLVCDMATVVGSVWRHESIGRQFTVLMNDYVRYNLSDRGMWSDNIRVWTNAGEVREGDFISRFVNDGRFYWSSFQVRRAVSINDRSHVRLSLQSGSESGVEVCYLRNERVLIDRS